MDVVPRSRDPARRRPQLEGSDRRGRPVRTDLPPARCGRRVSPLPDQGHPPPRHDRRDRPLARDQYRRHPSISDRSRAANERRPVAPAQPDAGGAGPRRGGRYRQWLRCGRDRCDGRVRPFEAGVRQHRRPAPDAGDAGFGRQRAVERAADQCAILQRCPACRGDVAGQRAGRRAAGGRRDPGFRCADGPCRATRRTDLTVFRSDGRCPEGDRGDRRSRANHQGPVAECHDRGSAIGGRRCCVRGGGGRDEAAGGQHARRERPDRNQHLIAMPGSADDHRRPAIRRRPGAQRAIAVQRGGRGDGRGDASRRIRPRAGGKYRAFQFGRAEGGSTG